MAGTDVRQRARKRAHCRPSEPAPACHKNELCRLRPRRRARPATRGTTDDEEPTEGRQEAAWEARPTPNGRSWLHLARVK